MAGAAFLTPEDKDILQKLARLLGITRPAKTRGRDSFHASEFYVGFPQDTEGIPAMSIPTGTATGSYPIPGVAICDIYRVEINSEGEAELHKIPGISRRVYNISTVAIAQRWVLLHRIKHGQWLAEHAVEVNVIPQECTGECTWVWSADDHQWLLTSSNCNTGLGHGCDCGCPTIQVGTLTIPYLGVYDGEEATTECNAASSFSCGFPLELFPNCYTISVSGVTNQDCEFCTSYNGDFSLIRPGLAGCIWNEVRCIKGCFSLLGGGSTTLSGRNHASPTGTSGWAITAGSTFWTLNTVGLAPTGFPSGVPRPEAVYRTSGFPADPTQPIVFTFQPSLSGTLECDNFPATITAYPTTDVPVPTGTGTVTSGDPCECNNFCGTALWIWADGEWVLLEDECNPSIDCVCCEPKPPPYPGAGTGTGTSTGGTTIVSANEVINVEGGDLDTTLDVWTITVNGDTTGNIDPDATDTEVQTALEAVVGAGNVVVKGGYAAILGGISIYIIGFKGDLANQDVTFTINPGTNDIIATTLQPGGSDPNDEYLYQYITATGGVYSLTIQDYGTTVNLDWDADDLEIGNAIEAVTGAGTVSIGSTLPANAHTIHFEGALSNENVEVTINTSLLTGGTGTLTVISDGGAIEIPGASEPELVRTACVNGETYEVSTTNSFNIGAIKCCQACNWDWRNKLFEVTVSGSDCAINGTYVMQYSTTVFGTLFARNAGVFCWGTFGIEQEITSSPGCPCTNGIAFQMGVTGDSVDHPAFVALTLLGSFSTSRASYSIPFSSFDCNGSNVFTRTFITGCPPSTFPETILVEGV